MWACFEAQILLTFRIEENQRTDENQNLDINITIFSTILNPYETEDDLIIEGFNYINSNLFYSS